MLMTYLGKIIFWNVSIVTDLILDLIALIRLLRCPKHRKLSHRSFSQAEILEKQWRFEFSKISQKVAWLPWQRTRGLIDETELFLMENAYKEKSQSSNSTLQAILKICCDLPG